MNRFVRPLIVVALGSLFYLQCTFMLDPDFGWHLRMGQIIQTTGIPQSDPFSYTMPDFPYIDHEWGYDVLLSHLYPLIGEKGLALITAMLALIALIISVWTAIKNRIREEIIIPLLLAGTILLNYVSIRPQVISWIFFSWCFYMGSLPVAWKRWRFFSPLIFLLWANIHGAFAAGIMSIGLMRSLFYLEKRKIHTLLKIKKEIAIDAGVLIISLFVTPINPYGIQLWKEVFDVAANANNRWTIQEWAPAILRPDLALESLLALSCLIIWRYRRRFSWPELGAFVFWLIQGISSQRHIPIWLLLALPMTARGILFLKEEVSRIPFGKERLQKVSRICLIACSLLILWQVPIRLQGHQQLSEEIFYPSHALQYIREHSSTGQIFSPYAWGGYLVWKLPEKKIFIDGRMGGWHEKGINIFEQYIEIETGGKPFELVAQKYSIDTVLWPVWEFSRKDELMDQIDQWWAEKVLQKKPHTSFLNRLRQEGWTTIYKDNTAVILRKN